MLVPLREDTVVVYLVHTRTLFLKLVTEQLRG